jgi:hypothetical protein
LKPVFLGIEFQDFSLPCAAGYCIATAAAGISIKILKIITARFYFVLLLLFAAQDVRAHNITRIEFMKHHKAGQADAFSVCG